MDSSPALHPPSSPALLKKRLGIWMRPLQPEPSPTVPRQLTIKQEAAFGYKPNGLGSRAQDKNTQLEGKLPIKWKSSSKRCFNTVSPVTTRGPAVSSDGPNLPAPYLVLAPEPCGGRQLAAHRLFLFSIQRKTCLPSTQRFILFGVLEEEDVRS